MIWDHKNKQRDHITRMTTRFNIANLSPQTIKSSKNMKRLMNSHYNSSSDYNQYKSQVSMRAHAIVHYPKKWINIL